MYNEILNENVKLIIDELYMLWFLSLLHEWVYSVSAYSTKYSHAVIP